MDDDYNTSRITNDPYISQEELQNESIIINTEKLNTVLYSSQFCGICLENNNDLSTVNATYEIFTKSNVYEKSMQSILFDVFHDVKHIPASHYICRQCLDKAIQTYIFIQNTKETLKAINQYINNFYSKIVQLDNQINPYKDDNLNYVVVLEKEESDDMFLFTQEEARTTFDCVKISDVKPVTDQQNKVLQVKLESIVVDNAECGIEKKPSGDFCIKEGLTRTWNSDEIAPEKGNKTIQSIMNAYKCFVCDVVMFTLLQWKKHIQAYHRNKSQLQCKVCHNSFICFSSLNEHYKTHSRVNCELCNEIVPEKDMQIHLKLNHHDDILSCENCDYVCISKLLLEVHIKNSHTELYTEENKEDTKESVTKLRKQEKCIDCSETLCIHYNYLVSFREQKLNGLNKIKCIDCDYICRTKKCLIGHVNREHLEYHPHECNICGTQYYSKYALNSHKVRSHQKIFSCNYCDQIIKDKSSLEIHISTCKQTTREVKCQQCEASFDSQEALTTHIENKHTTIFPCDLCNNKFRNASKLTEHKAKVHRNLQIKYKVAELLCPLCDIKFDLKGEYTKHLKIHHSEKKYPCKICKIQFNVWKKFIAHIRNHRKLTGNKVTCFVCDKKVLENDMKSHLEAHENIPHFLCDTCGKSFSSQVYLKQHMKSHWEPVPCELCKKLVKPISMQSHMKSHKYKQDPTYKRVYDRNRAKKYKCEYCDHAAYSRVFLEIHVNRYHLQVKPYICDTCGVAYSSKYQLSEHMRTHTMSKVFPCEICSRIFVYKRTLQKHLMTHNGERPYICDICGDGFTNIHSLKLHREKHDGKKARCPICKNMFYAVKDVRQHIKKYHWKNKNKPFDHTQVKGLSKDDYYIFKDGRKVTFDEDNS